MQYYKLKFKYFKIHTLENKAIGTFLLEQGIKT